MEEINENAVRIAGEVAEPYGCLVAGDLANTWVYDPVDQSIFAETKRQFDEQIDFQAPHGVDFSIASTAFPECGRMLRPE